MARVASSLGLDRALVREGVKNADKATLAGTPAATTVASMADELTRPSSRRRPGDDVPVHRPTCRVISVPRAADYAWRRAQTAEVETEARVCVHIRGLTRASRGTYGSPRVTAALRKQDVQVNHKRAQTGGPHYPGEGPPRPATTALSRVDERLGSCASRSAERAGKRLLSVGAQHASAEHA